MLAAMLNEFTPPNQSTNDGVVVAGKLSCLDSGFEFHTILLFLVFGRLILFRA
jgi:hypothetical protein